MLKFALLFKRSDGRVARQSSAKAPTAVRIRFRPLVERPLANHFGRGLFICQRKHFLLISKILKHVAITLYSKRN